MYRLLILIMATCVLSACSTTTAYTDKKYSATPSNRDIEVINRSGSGDSKKYTILAEIRADPIEHDSTDIKWFKEQGRKVGADAITVPEHNKVGFLVSYAVKYK